MFHVYAVIIGPEGQKTRWLAATEEDEFLAKHRANIETSGAADYAYIKDTRGGTVFFIRRPEYVSVPLIRPLPPPPAVPIALDQRRRKCRRP